MAVQRRSSVRVARPFHVFVHFRRGPQSKLKRLLPLSFTLMRNLFRCVQPIVDRFSVLLMQLYESMNGHYMHTLSREGFAS
jgi:hypothetical protein